MQASTPSSVIELLQQELAQLQQFVELLQREQGMLLENQLDDLTALAQQKIDAAQSLNALAQQRGHLLAVNMPQDQEAGLDRVNDYMNTQPQMAQLWSELLAFTAQARQLNNDNGEVIQMRMRHNQQALNVLHNAVNKSNLYGPNGQTDISNKGGRTLAQG